MIISVEGIGEFRCILWLDFVLQYPFCFYKMVLESKYLFFTL